MESDFYAVFDQALALLRSRGQVTYNALKLRFNLDDTHLAVLKEELLYAHPQVVDDAGRGLIWTSDESFLASRRVVHSAMMRLYEDLVSALLQREGRVSYRTLTQLFGLDEASLDHVRQELIFKQLARDAHSEGLEWAGSRLRVVETDGRHVTPTHVTDEIASTPSDEVPMPPAMSVRPAPEAERRQLTVLFCDLVGSTQLSGQLDPEDLRTVVRAYQEAAAAVIQSYEGHIAQYLGDGLLVYFGYPTAHEDDARRAVHTGLGIVQAIAILNTRLATQYSVQLAVRLGIHTGPAVVGVMGGGGRHEHLALGETPNIAARLEALAPADTVVISAVTARLVHGAFALEDLGTHTLHGVTEPMTLSRVRGLLTTRSRDEDFVTAGVPVLVGREEESGLLRRRWEQSKAGLGQVVFISGEAGIGKSALVEGLRAQVRTEGLPRIAFRCSPYHTNSAFSPVITHIEHLLQFAPDDSAEARLAKLEAGLRPYGLPLAEVVPLFAGLLSVPLAAERYAPLTLTPQQQKQQTLDALLAWLVAEAERQPVLVAWEDLHWADPTTLEYLGLVVEQAPTVPMLHVLTYRSEFSPPWPQRSHITPLVLNRLERQQVEALITQRAGGKILPAEVVQHIVAKTDGVPLYVEELTKMLLTSVLLREEVDQYVLTGPLHTVTIPDTLQDALMARLDQLNTAKEVAQIGAVLGREFAYELLQAIALQDEDTLQAGLAQLVGAELLYQRGRPPRAKYFFKHALIQDTAYASMLRSTRQQYHQKTARLLEAQFPEAVETQPELVAHHYTEAGLVEHAVRYWQQAGQRALQRSANLEAIGHLRHGLALLHTLPDTSMSLQQELDFQMALGPALMVTQGFAAPEVAQTYDRARELCQRVGDSPQLFPVLHGLWRFYVNRAMFQPAYELGDQLLLRAQGLGDPELVLEAHRALGQTVFWRGELPAVRTHMEQGLALYDSPQHRTHAIVYGQDPGVVCHAFAAWAAWLLGYPDQARHHIHAALTLSHALAHPFSLAYALICTAIVYRFCRDGPASQVHAEAAVTLATDQGFAFWNAWGTILRGRALADQGYADVGMAQMQQGLAAYEATGAAVFRPAFLALLAEVYGQVGEIEAGLATLTAALDLVDTTGECFWAPEIHRLKGELGLVLAPEQQGAAVSAFHQALTLARRQEAKSLELRAAMSLSRLWQQQGKQAEARALLTPIYDWFTEGFDTADLQEAKALLDALGE